MTALTYGSVCSGMEAAALAWMPLGWRCAFVSENAKAPCKLLKARYPDVPNLGDVTRYKDWPDVGPIDVLVGGTPCVSFSIAGLRRGLADPRGDLMLVYGAVAERLRPTWLVWENVPGVLSSNEGRDFGTFLAMLAELGFGFAYRILDAQFVRVESHPRAVPQRRRRVFVVGHSGGDWRAPAAVLFERESLRGDSPPRREAGQRAAGTIAGCANHGGANGPGRTPDDADTLVPVAYNITPSQSNKDFNARATQHAQAITTEGNRPTARGGDIITLAVRGRGDGCDLECRRDGVANALLTPSGGRAGIGVGAIAFADVADPVKANAAKTYTQEGSNNFRMSNVAFDGWAVRRLTPLECERLQGAPDGYTAVRNARGKLMADGPRYRMLGNSFAVNCVRWIGERIELVEAARR